MVTFGDEVTKIRKYYINICLHFARQDGQVGKNRIENHVTKVTKIPKTKGLKYGMNKTQEYTLHSLQLNAHRFTIEITKSIKIKANLNILAT